MENQSSNAHLVLPYYGQSFLPIRFGEIFLQPLRGKQIDHPHVHFKKSHDSLKMSCN